MKPCRKCITLTKRLEQAEFGRNNLLTHQKEQEQVLYPILTSDGWDPDHHDVVLVITRSVEELKQLRKENAMLKTKLARKAK